MVASDSKMSKMETYSEYHGCSLLLRDPGGSLDCLEMIIEEHGVLGAGPSFHSVCRVQPWKVIEL